MKTISIEHIKDHIRNRPYMGDIERDKNRTLQSSEFFTPTTEVQLMLDEYPQEQFSDPASIWCDNSCGDGQFLGEVLIRKIESGIDFETALNSIRAVDLMQDNVNLCQERLLCGFEKYRHIVEKNIVCSDATNWDYSWNGTNKTNEELRWNELFE